MDWSLDDRIFYFVDSGSRNIFAYDYDSATGDIENRRVVEPANYTVWIGGSSTADQSAGFKTASAMR